MDAQDEILKEFLVESRENLDRLDQDLVQLEKKPHDTQIISSIFRSIHTIKGTAGFFGLTRLESVTHSGENLLARLRDGKQTLTREIADVLLSLVDAVRLLLDSIEKTQKEGPEDFRELVARLNRLVEEPSAAPAQPHPQSAAPSTPPSEPVQPSRETCVGGLSDSSIRVDVGVLDRLMNLVGELVLARNQMLQIRGVHEDAAFSSASQRLNLVTTELQESVMKTRMQPIGNIWNKLPRVVRDLSAQCGKQVELFMEGNDTELDRTIIESIKDPLTHILRNSIDHGIEKPSVRESSGKTAIGRIAMRAYHEGGQVNIEITDDGAGIHLERVKQKAVEKGLIARERASNLSDEEAIRLVFAPGFSTAQTVSNVSGRGVGMDVVKTNIERIGGSVDLRSVPGQGCTVRIKIPLTLAIIPVLIVHSGEDRYAIPQVSLLELVRADGQGASRIETVHGMPVYRLRGRLLPIVYLNRLLQAGAERPRTDASSIVVLQAGGRSFGLVVDSVSDTEEIVVKPLAQQIKNNSLFAGATIMGDGRVALIMDVFSVARRANVLSAAEDRADTAPTESSNAPAKDCQALLIFSCGGQERMAVYLHEVQRLEEIPVDRVELIAGRPVTQFRGHIMPLIRLDEILFDRPGQNHADKMLTVLVCDRGDSVAGLVVDRIHELVHEAVSYKRKATRKGVKGTAVIKGHVTEVLDLQGVLDLAKAGALSMAGI